MTNATLTIHEVATEATPSTLSIADVVPASELAELRSKINEWRRLSPASLIYRLGSATRAALLYLDKETMPDGETLCHAVHRLALENAIEAKLIAELLEHTL